MTKRPDTLTLVVQWHAETGLALFASGQMWTASNSTPKRPLGPSASSSFSASSTSQLRGLASNPIPHSHGITRPIPTRSSFSCTTSWRALWSKRRASFGGHSNLLPKRKVRLRLPIDSPTAHAWRFYGLLTVAGLVVGGVGYAGWGEAFASVRLPILVATIVASYLGWVWNENRLEATNRAKAVQPTQTWLASASASFLDLTPAAAGLIVAVYLGDPKPIPSSTFALSSLNNASIS